MRFFSGTGNFGKLAVLSSLLLGATGAEAKVIYVNGAHASSGNGTTWTSAFKYLRDALDASAQGDQIYVAKGTYYPDDGESGYFGDRELSFELDKVTIYGGFAGTETSLGQRNRVANPTILSGEIWAVTPTTPGYERYWSLHVVVLKGNSKLDGVTIEKGRANGDDAPYNQGGGCLAPSGTTLTLVNCTLDQNMASQSGGAVAGTVVAANCTFSNNFVNNEFLLSSGPDRLRNWLFSPDCSGGAVAGDITATNCKFLTNQVVVRALDLQNVCSSTGGAISGTTINLRGCVFDSNEAIATAHRLPDQFSGATANVRGGAVSGGVVNTVDCTFTKNMAQSFAIASVTGRDPQHPLNSNGYLATASSFGGAIAGQVNLANCSFDQNTTDAEATSGDVYDLQSNGGAVYAESTSTAVNCTFFGDSVTYVDGTLLSNARTYFFSVQGGGLHIALGGALPVTNSTFLDNITDFDGAAISSDGSVTLISNIIWDTTSQSNLIFVGGRGRISNRIYPTPSTETINIITGGRTSILSGLGANVDFGEPPSRTLPDLDPLFVDVTNAIGPDGIWRTPDDGIRLTEDSPAIGKGHPLFIPLDTLDLDEDGDKGEKIPIDAANYERVQGPALDLGAYEFGNILHTPEISVEQPVGSILNDGGSAIALESGVPMVFVIRNLGNANLKNLSVYENGANTDSYTYTQPLKKFLVPGDSTTFTVTFRPTVGGSRKAAVHIVSNDIDENPFDIAMDSTALLPDIAVEQPVGTGLTDAVSTVNYGTVSGLSSVTKSFTIRNTGPGVLKILGITESGLNVKDFSVSAPLATTVASGATTTFNVTFRPSENGLRKASVIIQSNDPDAESLFAFNIQGTGVLAPEIAVSQPFSPDMVDGGSSAFGSVQKGLLYKKTFTIKNVGSATLKNIAVSISGSSAFSKTAPGATSLAPGAKTTFTVTFKPTSKGKKTGLLKIASNDTDENPFDINLTGTGVTSAAAPSGLAAALAASAPVSLLADSQSDINSSVTVTKSSDGLKYLVLTVEKPLDWGLAKHTVEVSPNLLDWFSGANYTTTVVNNGKVLKVRDNTPIKEGAKRYIRLK
ncbi:MAG: choice-of-anchor D domain-containing protein [Luteolibacter sp.]